MAPHDAALDRLGSGKYLLVTTYRKDGRTVPTPVWVVRDGDTLGVWTVADSGKVKRIRNRGDVLLAPCDVRGNRKGDDIPGFAEILDAAATERYRALLKRKYGLLGRLTVLGSRLRRGREGSVGIRITLRADDGTDSTGE
ncbi:PPOX class probable F420-dependent enzyme [Streptacidiphilus sp. MAP12-16]|uniref:PPOX class F420-dependent oxidoreductase n=1 Tax=Streptacidiphilus sp. MAP12-16 TaxID=3156300 RepID=UPI003514C11F